MIQRWLKGRSDRIVLTLHLIQAATFTGINVFLTTFLYQAGDIRIPALFQAVMVTFQTIAFALVAPIAFGTWIRRLTQLGLVLIAAVFVALFFVGEAISDLVVPTAAILGLALGLFWLPVNLVCIAMPSHERVQFLNRSAIWMRIVTVVCPLALGLLISGMGGYTAMFILIALGQVLSIVAAHQLRPNGRPRGQVGYRALFSALPGNRRVYGPLLVMAVMGASVFGAFEMVLNVLLFRATQSEASVGLANSLVPLVGVLILLLVKRGPPSRYPALAALASAGGILAAILAAVIPSSGPVVLISAAISISLAGHLAISNIYSFSLVDTDPRLRDAAGAVMVLREVSWNFGRMIGFISIIFLPRVETHPAEVMFLLALASCSIPALYWWIERGGSVART